MLQIAGKKTPSPWGSLKKQPKIRGFSILCPCFPIGSIVSNNKGKEYRRGLYLLKCCGGHSRGITNRKTQNGLNIINKALDLSKV